MRTNTGLVVLFFALLTGCGEASITQVAPPAPPSAMKVLMEFTGNDRASWWIVNDDVMGGRSNSNISLTGDRTALFTGFVSLDNNGGFASARAGFPSLDLSAFKGVTLRIKGDGRKYQLRFSHAGSYSAVAHGVEFTTTPGEWTEIDLPFESFQPSYRGYVPRGIGPLDLTRLQQMTILIGDKKEGEFALEIDWVKAYHVSR